MNHKSILCGFWPQSEVFPPEQERPASVRIGLGFSFSWNTFCSVLHGPTRDHSADIFRGHVPRASVAKREGQWRVWCYINTWRKVGERKNPGWPWWVLEYLSSRNYREHPTEKRLKMAATYCVYVYICLCVYVCMYKDTHTCTNRHHTLLCTGALLNVCEVKRPPSNITLWSFRTFWGTLASLGLKMAASKVQGLFSPAKP